MQIDTRALYDSAQSDRMQASEVGWFAAKQPALLSFLESELSHCPDAMAMAVDLCWQVVAAFEAKHAQPIARIEGAELLRAQRDVVAESMGQMPVSSSCAARQPELCRHVEAMLESTSLPLEPPELSQVALAAATTIVVCDRAHWHQGEGRKLAI